MRYLRIGLLLAAVCLLVLAGCAKSPAPDPTVVATVGDRVIRAEDVQREIAAFVKGFSFP